jgi:hypothetical protein
VNESEVTLVRECVERTLAAESARVELVREFHLKGSLDAVPRRRRRGGLLRPVMKLLKLAIRALWRRWTRDLNLGRVAGKGVAEFSKRRFWWLVDLLRGIADADHEGDDLVRGTRCRRLATRVDLSVASAASKDGLRPPTVQRFEELLALPLTVWLDETYVRRVRFSEFSGGAIQTLDVWDFGVDTSGIDWSQRPIGLEIR